MSNPYTGPARVRVLPPGFSFKDVLDERPAGMVPRRQRERSPKMKAIRCSLCGEAGHNKATCQKRKRAIKPGGRRWSWRNG